MDSIIDALKKSNSTGLLKIRHFQLAIKARNLQSYKDQPAVYYGCNLSAEVGELNGTIGKLHRKESGVDTGNDAVLDDKTRLAMGKEMADIISNVCLIANKYDIDLENMMVLKFNEISDRVKSDIKI